MCGIFGWSLNPSVKPSQRKPLEMVAAVLACHNDSRGGHSWGFAADGVITKGLGRMARAKPSVASAMAKASTVMAHTRYGTHGAKTVDNAHPFEVGPIVGAHNGIVHNHDELNKRHGRKCQVDSMHFFHNINECLPTEEIEAYGAVEWFDREHGVDSIMLARFNDGELAIAQTKLGIVWSSDESHLADALAVSGINTQWHKVKQATLYTAHNGALYKVGKFAVTRAVRSTLRWNDFKSVHSTPIDDPWERTIDYNTMSEEDELQAELDELEAEHLSWTIRADAR